MVVSPDKGARIIEAYERLINDALMELVCRPSHTYTPSRAPLIDALEEIADLRFGAEPSYPRAAGYYSGPLYWDVFAGDPPGNTRYRMQNLCRRFHHIWVDRDVDRMVTALRKFHTDYADGCQEQQMDRLSIISLLNEFVLTMT
jgi:hypothetical protein